MLCTNCQATKYLNDSEIRNLFRVLAARIKGTPTRMNTGMKIKPHDWRRSSAEVLGDNMVEKFLVMLEAFTIGLLISIGALAVVLVVFGPYFLFVIFAYLLTVFPLTIIGALIGKFFTKNHLGTFLGAALGVLLGYWRLFLMTSNMLLGN